jgi:hypothetical protein
MLRITVTSKNYDETFNDESDNPLYPKGYLRLLAYGDRHYPNTIECADRILLNVIRDLQPHYIIDGGDFICASSLSDYPKPNKDKGGLQKELDADSLWRININNASPDSVKILLSDNHFGRRLVMRKYEAPWAQDLNNLTEEHLVNTSQLGWKLLPHWKWKNVLLFVHSGGSNRGASSSTRTPINRVRSLVNDLKLSVVRFHSHTTGFELYRNHDGNTIHAIQLGCFEDPLKADYIEPGQFVNWTHSFGVFYLSTTTNEFFFVPCTILNNKLIFSNKVYS